MYENSVYKEVSISYEQWEDELIGVAKWGYLHGNNTSGSILHIIHQGKFQKKQRVYC